MDIRISVPEINPEVIGFAKTLLENYGEEHMEHIVSACLINLNHNLTILRDSIRNSGLVLEEETREGYE